MGAFQVVNKREKIISRQGVKGEGCPRCGGFVVAMEFDTQLIVFCVPLPHRVKRKYCCVVCSTPLTYTI